MASRESPATLKPFLRQLYKNWLRLNESLMNEWSAMVRSELKNVIGSSQARTIGAWAALPGEPDLLPLMNDMPEIQWCLPRIVDEKSSQMEFVDWVPGDCLETNRMGIREPQGAISARELDLVLIPGLAFDQRGFRLGRGKGFYDRWLSRHPKVTTMGVAWSGQIVTELPAAPTDLPVHSLCTESGWIPCGTSSRRKHS